MNTVELLQSLEKRARTETEAWKKTLQLFEEMKEGKYEDGQKVLRAKIDMASPNMNMRDPVIYRVAHMTHHRYRRYLVHLSDV